MRCRSCCSAQFHIHGMVKLFSPHKQCYSHFGSYFCCFCNLLCLHLHLCSACMDTVCQLPFSSSSFLFSSSLLSQRGPQPFMQLSLYTCLWTGGERLSILREPTHTQDQEEEDGKLHSGRTQLTISFKQETVVSLSQFFQYLSIIWENEENTITQ